MARVTSTATPFVPTEHNIAGADVGISQETIQGAAENMLPSSVNDEQCVCGTKCKSRRGLKAHQRSFHTFKTLVTSNPLPQNECLTESQEQAPLDLIGLQSASSPTDSVSQPSSSPVLVAKSGLKLPKTKERWAEANIYFHSIFASLISQLIEDLDEAVKTAQDQVYSYFSDTCGTIQLPSENDYANKYDNQSIKQLKNSLRLLKRSEIAVNTSEIKYLSALIRSRINKTGHQVTPENHRLESELKTKFWPTFYKLFAQIINLPPAFSVSQCYDYFLSTLSQLFSPDHSVYRFGYR